MSRENSRAASRLAFLATNGELIRFGASVLRILSSARKLGYLDDASSSYKACSLSKKQKLMTSKHSRNFRKRQTKAQTFTEASLQGIGTEHFKDNLSNTIFWELQYVQYHSVILIVTSPAKT